MIDPYEITFQLKFLQAELEKKENAEHAVVLVAVKKLLVRDEDSTDEDSTKEALDMLQKQHAEHPENYFVASLLGFCYQNGIGVAPDPTKASEFYLAALKHKENFAFAAHNLALFYNEKIPENELRRNKPEAIRLLTIAADQGYLPAEYHLAWINHDDRVAEANKLLDPGESLEIYRESMRKLRSSMRKLHEARFAPATYDHVKRLGITYGDKERDNEHEFQYLSRAAEMGHRRANLDLGLLFYNKLANARVPYTPDVLHNLNQTFKYLTFVLNCDIPSKYLEDNMIERMRDVCKTFYQYSDFQSLRWKRALFEFCLLVLKNIASATRRSGAVLFQYQNSNAWYYAEVNTSTPTDFLEILAHAYEYGIAGTAEELQDPEPMQAIQPDIFKACEFAQKMLGPGDLTLAILNQRLYVEEPLTRSDPGMTAGLLDELEASGAAMKIAQTPAQRVLARTRRLLFNFPPLQEAVIDFFGSLFPTGLLQLITHYAYNGKDVTFNWTAPKNFAASRSVQEELEQATPLSLQHRLYYLGRWCESERWVPCGFNTVLALKHPSEVNPQHAVAERKQVREGLAAAANACGAAQAVAQPVAQTQAQVQSQTRLCFAYECYSEARRVGPAESPLNLPLDARIKELVQMLQEGAPKKP